ncbi:Uncharacterised protein [Legionella lansingensis]|uniref:Uncharacterized protein n=1 Tax=Legionella lansingensis TaxID=45067 RepID=A0A0W0W156_9GAMM|nr:hypothetical protein [Legionella lansingensis]KTD26123.1 hypothetical protein Llan_0018 [Legionella lansingensis]SNV52640.1 Uncharacterised protein [Legionella lansingensis]
MAELEKLKENQLAIEHALDELKIEPKKFAELYTGTPGLRFNTWLLRLGEAEKSQSRWTDYQGALRFITQKLEELAKENEFEKLFQQRLLCCTLLSALKLLGYIIAAVEQKEDSKQKERFPEILAFQKSVALHLQKVMPQFQLPYQSLEPEKRTYVPTFALRTNKIEEEYESAYLKNFSGGCLGFFKLAIKTSCRHKSRTEELQFLQNVDGYLEQQRGKMHMKDAKLFRLSALNLVRWKIETEWFGRNSLLHKIIVGKLEAAGLKPDDDTMIEGFLKICKEKAIHVPDGLVSCYENDLVDASPANTF